MNYYNEIKNKLIDNEIYEKVKDYSKRLVIEVGKKYNARTLRSMRQLYVMFSDDFWTSFLLIMPLKEQSKMYYYANQCLNYI